MNKISKRYGFSSVPVYFAAEQIIKIKNKRYAVYHTKSGYLLSSINKKNEVVETYGGKPAGVGRIGYATAREALIEGRKLITR